MKRHRAGISLLVGFVTVLSVNESVASCGQSSSPTITNLPAADAYSYQVNGLNGAGQLTGFFNANGNSASHAFLYNGQVFDLGTLGGSISEGLAINSAGQVVGDSQLSLGDPSLHAILSDGTNMLDLGTLGGPYSSASALNDSGQIVGASLTADFAFDAFSYANGTMVNLGDFGGAYSAAFAINKNGVIVGESANTNQDIHGFVYANGTMQDVGTLGGNYSSAFWVNSSGVVGGESATTNGDTHGFVLSGSGLQDVGTFGGTFSSVSKVNDAGLAIGVATTLNEAETHGFVFVNGTLVDLGTFGGTNTFASDINNGGLIVGSSEGTDGNARAFLWQNGTLTDLNQLVPGSGWLLQNASFINDAGRIVGQGTLNGVSQNFILDLSSANHAPTAVAGADQTVDCKALVTLDGTTSSDPDGDALTFEWSSAGNVLGTNATLSGYFALGTNVVTLKVSDSCGASSEATVTVVVKDTTVPTISAPAQIEAAAGAGCQASVPNVSSFITVSDNCTAQADLQVSQSPSPGTVVTVGDHPIQVTVTDLAGNVGSATIVLHVVDKTAPTIVSTPGPLTVAAGSDCQGIVPNVLGDVVASDNCTAASQLMLAQSPVAGTSVEKGQHTITVTVTDLAGNHTSANVSLTVVDQTAPVIASAPGAQTVAVGDDCQGIVPNVLAGVVASDNCTAANQLVMSQSPAAGNSVAKGQYVITVLVKDSAGNQSSVGVPLSVVDQTAPVIHSATVNPNVLSPPNHQMVPVTVSLSATDNCDGAPVSKITSIACNESVQPGETVITGALTANLAATRNGGSGGRVYTLTIQCTDNSGNSSQTTVTVTVPQGKK
jgi:probable HAF family extracellular repeat protein